MLYNFLYPLHIDYSWLNVFRYITFRAIGSSITALLFVIIVGPIFIAWLKKKQIGQVIREDGPESHFSKQGVPTMGGVLILAAMIFSTFIWADLTNGLVWLLLGVSIFFGIIGSVDDWKKIRKGNSRGLTAREKLALQVVGASIVGLYLILHPVYDGVLSLPFFKAILPDLGWWYIPLAVLVIVGASNAVNLTDGLDGLAAGPIVITGAVYLVFSYVAGNMVVAQYLQIPFVQGAGEVAVYCGTLVGACLGFLWFNAYPAQIFMGDVGSLSLGGTLGAVSIITKQELLLAIVGGIFVLEAVSVILQVGYFKLTAGKRIFLMAPIHHHFEKKGWVEPKVVVRFWIISIILGLIGLATLKLR
ncbi:phospho-N-acetylmuramoyl-pentapeptide-transferase [Desulfogranum marinum]|jgi:phospho-N-acetylmuramoyl-pentapeptide-transferase|uniref:phospho-N-acetylmuramoyl-pentapeptide- transferase n=1 Tax=Desulfogranum marinum TaxID=453220 RepID=UPI0019650627|nr:phospho-N-acetylmuramoyl-pentapeptide-transferase [Desulfogranum marinum]MBM9511074.1 phospho-N-acetylmuramoyl-pentapeptide-transferase [Desulfogranum marinum]